LNRLFCKTCLVLVLVLSVPLSAFAGNVPEPISKQRIVQELVWSLPGFWQLESIELLEGFFADKNQTTWKARFKAKISTIEQTYFPEKLSIGGATVLRAVYAPGIERVLNGRLTYSLENDDRHHIAFELDNRVTKSAGLPLNYFVGNVVVSGTENFRNFSKQIHESEIERVLDEHASVIHKMAVQHKAEVETLRQQLSILNDVEAVRDEIEKRIEDLKHMVDMYNQILSEQITRLGAVGPVIRQWASAADKVSAEGKIDRNDKLQALGPPNVVKAEACKASGPDKAWRAGREGNQYIELRFNEAVIPTELAIYQAGSPGFVKQVVFSGEEHLQRVAIDTVDTNETCPGISTIPITGVPFASDKVKIVVDADHGKGYESIDAVMLTGVLPITSQSQ